MIWAIILQVNMTMAGPIVAGHIQKRDVKTTIEQQTSHEVLHSMQILMAKRLRKRHSSFQDTVSKELNTPFALDWSNPCGGMWVGDKRKKSPNRHTFQFKKNKSLRVVKDAALRAHRSLPLKTKALNTSDIRIWKHYNANYNFLPKIDLNANITLRRWHRHLQIYTAAFGYLHRASLYADQTQAMFETDLSKSLRLLKLSARNVLCEIESAINATTKVTTVTKGATTTSLVNNHKYMQSHNRNHLKQRPILNIRPTIMLERLQFKMSFKAQLNTENGTLVWNTNKKLELNPLDMKFAKKRYLDYLRGIVNVLKKYLGKQKKQTTSTGTNYTHTYTRT